MCRITVADKLRKGGYDDLVEMTIYSCNHRKIETPLAYFDPTIDGTLDEYCQDWLIHEYIDEYDQIQEINNKLVVIHEPDEKCEGCAKGKVYCMDTKRPTGFESVVKNHGILAYQRDETDYSGAINHLEKVLTVKNYETCCSTMCLGPIGVVLDGEVVTASNEDLYSQVDSRGRYYYATEADEIIYNANELRYDTELNDEIVVINPTIRYIWIKEDASNEVRSLAIFLSQKYNVKIVEVPLTKADKEALYAEKYEDKDWLF